jgi:hexosaminidase
MRAPYRIDSIRLKHPPADKYAGNGPETLIDRQLAALRVQDEAWLGFEGLDLEATLDLGRSVPISKIGLSCMEDHGAWIMLPAALEAELSADGVSFAKAGSLRVPPSKGMRDASLHYLALSFAEQEARYVRLRVKNPEKLPAWHPGSGQKPWIFAAEILLE